ncbi:MAG: hypothetical protein AAFV53_39225, partial [Myxococcota bacterium]
ERRALGLCTLTTGAAMVAAIALLPIIPEERLIGHLVGPGPGNIPIFHLTGIQISADRLLIYLAAVTIPGAASGAGFPIAAAAATRDRDGLGLGVGLTGAVGIGAAVGVSLWMGFLPTFGPGTVHLMVLLGVCAMALGALILQRWPAILLAAAGAAAWAVPPWAGLQIPPRETVQAFVETAAGPSAVASNPQMTHVYTHGERVGGLVLDLEYPLALHPDPKRVLVIAFGTGINIRSFLNDPAIAALTCVDIDPALPSLAAHIPATGSDLFDGDRARFVNADGRHLLRQTDQRWDIIYNDVATYAQYVELGTVEFFQQIRGRLAPGGAVTVKLHPDTLTPEGLRRFLATFLTVFPDAALFGRRNPVPVLVGFTDGMPSTETLRLRAAAMADRFGEDAAPRFAQHALLGPSGLAAFAKDATPATDDRPLSLRNVLVGPLSRQTAQTSALQPLVQAAQKAGTPVVAEIFGEPLARKARWAPTAIPIPRRRGWFKPDKPPNPAPPPPRQELRQELRQGPR